MWYLVIEWGQFQQPSVVWWLGTARGAAAPCPGFEQPYLPAVLPDRWALIRGARLLYSPVIPQPSSRCSRWHALRGKTRNMRLPGARAHKRGCDESMKAQPSEQSSGNKEGSEPLVRRAWSPQAHIAVSLERFLSVRARSLPSQRRDACACGNAHWAAGENWSKCQVREAPNLPGAAGRWTWRRLHCLSNSSMWSPAYYDYSPYVSSIRLELDFFFPQREQHLERLGCWLWFFIFFFNLWMQQTTDWSTDTGSGGRSTQLCYKPCIQNR